ncbi:hypothetical protein [Modestobacter versicolor]|uniref:Uncharacterized protein n=1 Tax=Modestobacter versicolor TaxID=429133 RepID=A0A323VJD8_9ACTN|nr:hypothetical protein [Modestobacter versicolor]MBB3677175.1 hypothetical protein [Modestobacter versicolor]PZA20118.1 hypothetical protein DMO24_17130 [Modestobacter versicolor]
MTAQLLFDGTFSTDAVASAGHRLVQQLHDEAMATIASLAETWDRPAEDAPAVDEEPLTYQDPATWSVVDDEDEQYGEDDEDDDVLVLPQVELPALLPRPRRATTNVAAPVDPEPAGNVAAAVTDEFAVPAERQYA